MSLSRDDVEHVALLSRLHFSEEELTQFTAQLNDILGHFAALQEADTSHISATTHVVPMVNVLRDDNRRPSLDPDAALANAPERVDDLYKVPRVVE